MLKLNFVLFLVILCGGVHLNCGEKLQCKFQNVNYDVVGFWYSCKVTSLANIFDNITIDGYTGVHKTSKNDKDVKAIWINGANIKYIPRGLGSLFNLLALIIYNSQLVEIRSKDFYGMENLEYLSLYDNKLTSVSSDAFSTLPKIKLIRLMSNQIEEISSELFSNNLNLKYIDFYDNRIRYIGSDVFNNLRNLNIVKFGGNICLEKDYIGIDGIIEMKKDIITNCKNPATITTTTTTTTQNPMEVELEALKNESSACKETQQKNQNELNKLKDYLQKEKLENIKIRKDKDALKIEAKGQQQMNEIELNKLRDDLKKEQLENSKVKMDHEEVQSRNDQLKSELSVLKVDLQNKVIYSKKINIEISNLIIELAAKQENLNQNQQEKIHLINENNVLKNNLTAAKNEKQEKTFGYEIIERKNKELMTEKDALMINHDALKKEKDALIINHDELKKEKDALIINHNALKKEKDALIINHNALKKEKDLLKKEKDALMINHNALKKEKDLLKKEKDALMINHDALKKEKDLLKKEKGALMINHNALKKEKDSLKKEKDDLMIELINKTTEINELKLQFETNCKYSNEALNVKFNGIMNHLLKESQDHQKECQAITNLRFELSTAKDQQNKEQEANSKNINEVTRERDQLEKKLTDELTDLKKEIAEAKETIDQKLPKMEQLIEDFFLEVFELKNERHYQREDLIALRTKLMEAKEQLAECKNE